MLNKGLLTRPRGAQDDGSAGRYGHGKLHPLREMPLGNRISGEGQFVVSFQRRSHE